jgi:hypothetical protein
MQKWTERAEDHRADKAMQPSTETVPRIIRRISTDFGLRHVRGVAVIRLLVAVWLVILGSIFCAFGQWWGTFFFVLAGLHGWLAYQMPRWNLALKALNDARLQQ